MSTMWPPDDDPRLDECAKGQDCPNCPNQGWYACGDTRTGEQYQVQCEFCETVPDSKFNLRRTTTSQPVAVKARQDE